MEKWLPECRLLVTYVAGPFADEQGNTVLRQWLEAGGRWLALHGSSGGKAVRRPDTSKREMVKMPYHETLGGFFINHPPIRKFRVDLADPQHPLTRGLPESFVTVDEPYRSSCRRRSAARCCSPRTGARSARTRRPASTSSATRPCCRTAAARSARSPSCAN
ncbi:MAG: ThuA domain-containing protein [Chloroflexi bacterium]|nr:ThuA domain-containing protein [Chloroflexota bacterium]